MFPELTPEQLGLRDELRAYFSALMSPAERAEMLTERHGAVYREVVLARAGHRAALGCPHRW
jgi:3-oxo-4-pregnene-20-carboxyl-CoA dehydrogenase beta subunit